MSSKNIQSEGTEGRHVGQFTHQSKHQPIRWVTETGVAPAGGRYPSRSSQSRGRGEVTTSSSALGTLVVVLCFLLYSLAFSVV